MAFSGQPEGGKDKKTLILGGIIVLVIVLFTYTLFTSGQAGVWALLNRFLKYVIWIVVLGLLLFVVLKILQKTPVDLVENDRQDIVEAGVLSKPPMVNNLYFTGDKEHGEFKVGKIVGYVQLQSYKDMDILAGLTPDQIKKMEQQGRIPSDYIIREDCFVFKTMMWPFSIFEKPKVLRTLEDEHSQLIGDVKVFAVSMIKKYGYYFPNRGHLDIARIDIAVIREAWRGQIHQFLKDMVSINQRAVGLDAEYKKELDRRKLLKVPSPLGEGEQRQ